MRLIWWTECVVRTKVTGDISQVVRNLKDVNLDGYSRIVDECLMKIAESCMIFLDLQVYTATKVLNCAHP